MASLPRQFCSWGFLFPSDSGFASGWQLKLPTTGSQRFILGCQIWQQVLYLLSHLPGPNKYNRGRTWLSVKSAYCTCRIQFHPPVIPVPGDQICRLLHAHKLTHTYGAWETRAELWLPYAQTGKGVKESWKLKGSPDTVWFTFPSLDNSGSFSVLEVSPARVSSLLTPCGVRDPT